MITVGSQAPDFSLNDQHGQIVKLSSFKGKKVLLSFRPLAWTPVCTDQMKHLEANFNRLKELNTVALGIGVDSSPSNKQWGKANDVLKTKLLSDFWPHGEIAVHYGVFRENDGFSERANIIIDEQGQVIFTKLYAIGEQPDIEEIIQFLGG